MKKILSIIIIAVALSSCNDTPADDQVTIYNINDFYEKVIVKDTTCENATKRAKEDISKGRLSLNERFIYESLKNESHNIIDSLETQEVLHEYLKSYGISIDTTLMFHNDIRTTCDNLFRADCYQYAMKDAVFRKLPKFPNQIFRKAEENFIKKHPGHIYSEEQIDGSYSTVPAKGFQDCIKKLQLYLSVDFNYPSEYKPKAEDYFSYTDIKFILMKDGTIKNPQVISTFQNPENEKFRKYFRNEIIDYINKSKWVRGTIWGIPVNTEITMLIFHK